MRRRKIWIYALYMFSGCVSKPSCEIMPGAKFTGEGIIVLQRGQGQDGYHHMTFFPVCQLDTTDILASLRKAGVGLNFSTTQWHLLIRPTTYGQVQSPFKEKTITLTTNEPIEKNVHCWNCGLNDRFIIPVNITFSDTLDIYPVSKRIYSYTLKTKQGNFALRSRSTSTVVVHRIDPL